MGLVDQQGTVMGRAGNQIRLRSDPSVPVSPRATVGRRRNRSVAGFDSSPDSLGDAEEEETVDGRKRLPGVKRACNECRQQKVSASLPSLLSRKSGGLEKPSPSEDVRGDRG